MFPFVPKGSKDRPSVVRNSCELRPEPRSPVSPKNYANVPLAQIGTPNCPLKTAPEKTPTIRRALRESSNCVCCLYTCILRVRSQKPRSRGGALDAASFTHEPPFLSVLAMECRPARLLWPSDPWSAYRDGVQTKPDRRSLPRGLHRGCRPSEFILSN